MIATMNTIVKNPAYTIVWEKVLTKARTLNYLIPNTTIIFEEVFCQESQNLILYKNIYSVLGPHMFTYDNYILE